MSLLKTTRSLDKKIALFIFNTFFRKKLILISLITLTIGIYLFTRLVTGSDAAASVTLFITIPITIYYFIPRFIRDFIKRKISG